MRRSKSRRSIISASTPAASVNAMSNTCKWTASHSRAGNTEFIRLFQGGERLTYKELFGLLQDDRDFAGWYTELLARAPFTSFFWEHPPLTISNFECAAEFVIIDAPMLADWPPNADSFRSYFTGEAVVTFQNLGGDATLIVPSPTDSSSAYAHLATFVQKAPASQVNALWQRVGQAVSRSLSDEPMWLSTSGLGVAWLHIRLDSTPKYYQHQPYTSRDRVDLLTPR